LALAGGVDLLLDETVYLLLSEGKALSPEGRCRAFDVRANGYVPGEGAGAVLLKPLERAVADGDRVVAVILGSAINSDGRTMGITTPSLSGQEAVIEAALARAGVPAGTISYLEAHGTGTAIGDPIELRALTQVFGRHTTERQFCGVGSVKTNIGHLHSAAGIAGVIKVAMALRAGELPPTLHCEVPNPRFDFAASPFFVNSARRAWISKQGVRRAGISSFGFGGSNGHLVLEEFGAGGRSSDRPARQPLPAPRFERRRCWLERPETGPASEEASSGCLEALAEEPVSAHSNGELENAGAGDFLVLEEVDSHSGVRS
jgi:acyl transferase domain-containing protein